MIHLQKLHFTKLMKFVQKILEMKITDKMKMGWCLTSTLGLMLVESSSLKSLGGVDGICL